MNKKIVYCLDGLVFILLLFIVFINQSQISNHNGNKSSLIYLNHIFNNWNQKVFEDVSMNSRKGFSIEDLAYYEGSEEGCRCLNQDINQYVYTKGKCERVNETCLTIEPIPPQNLSSSTMFLGYVKRGEFTYLDYLKNAKSEKEKCDIGYKQCGILDTAKNKMCLPENATCPINFITFFIYSNIYIDNPIFISLNVSQNDLCIHPYYKKDDNPFPLRNNYEFHRDCIEIYPGKTTENRFLMNANTSSVEYYMSERLYPLAEHEKLNNVNGEMRLYQINYIGLNLSCYSQNSKQYEQLKKMNIPKILQYYRRSIIIYYMLEFLFIFLIVSNVFYWITIAFSLYSLKARISNSIWSLNCLLGFISSFLIMSFFFQIKLNIKLNYGCFNEEFENFLFQDAEELLRVWKSKDATVLIISLIIGIISFIRDFLTKEENLDINYLHLIERREEEEENEEGVINSDFYKEDSSIEENETK